MNKKIYKGYELVKAIEDGEIKEGTILIFTSTISKDNKKEVEVVRRPEGLILYKKDAAEILPTSWLFNSKIEILEDNTEEIEEYKGESFEQLGYEIGKMSTAIVRGLIKAVNEMEKPTEKEHCCNCGVEITDENRALHNMCNECKYGIDWKEKE